MQAWETQMRWRVRQAVRKVCLSGSPSNGFTRDRKEEEVRDDDSSPGEQEECHVTVAYLPLQHVPASSPYKQGRMGARADELLAAPVPGTADTTYPEQNRFKLREACQRVGDHFGWIAAAVFTLSRLHNVSAWGPTVGAGRDLTRQDPKHMYPH